MELTIGETITTKRKRIDFEDFELKVKGHISIVNDKIDRLYIGHIDPSLPGVGVDGNIAEGLFNIIKQLKEEKYLL